MKKFLFIAMALMAVQINLSAQNFDGAEPIKNFNSDSVCGTDTCCDVAAVQTSNIQDDREFRIKQAEYEHQVVMTNRITELCIVIFVCFLLPTVIVFLYLLFRRKREKERTEMLRLMIEKGQDVTGFIVAEKQPKQKTPTRNLMWTWGLVLSFIGLAGTIFFAIVKFDAILPFALIMGAGLGLIIAVITMKRIEKKND